MATTPKGSSNKTLPPQFRPDAQAPGAPAGQSSAPETTPASDARPKLEVVSQGAQLVTGRMPDPPPSAQTALRMDALPNWIYLHHPHRWDIELDEEGTAHLVPTLRRFLFEPGLSGVEQHRGQAQGNPTRALASRSEWGWYAIPTTLEVPAWGGRERGYVRVYDGHRGLVHLDIWTRPYALGGRVELDFDLAGRLAFKLELLSSGIVKPPTDPVRRAIRNKFRRALQMRQSSETAQAVTAAEIIEQKMAVFATAGRT